MTYCFRMVKRDHPRLRGEYNGEFRADGAPPGSPPLARGIPDYSGWSEYDIGITPACAGNT